MRAAKAAFPRSVRLRRPQEFKAVMKGGKRVHSSMLTAVAKDNDRKAARLGLAISARSVPRAPDRNRIKRLARESFRRHRAELGAFDIVIMARNGAGNARRAEVHTALSQIWERFGRRA